MNIKQYGADTRATKGTYVRLTSLERKRRHQPINESNRLAIHQGDGAGIFENQQLQVKSEQPIDNLVMVPAVSTGRHLSVGHKVIE